LSLWYLQILLHPVTFYWSACTQTRTLRGHACVCCGRGHACVCCYYRIWLFLYFAIAFWNCSFCMVFFFSFHFYCHRVILWIFKASFSLFLFIEIMCIYRYINHVYIQVYKSCVYTGI
jgi:hypothetical protein